MLRIIVIFATILVAVSAIPFNFDLFGGQSFSPSVEAADAKTLRYPKNSLMEGILASLQPDMSMKAELDNLKYPKQSWLEQTTADVLRVISGVRQQVEGVVKQVQANPEMQGISKVFQSVLGVR